MLRGIGRGLAQLLEIGDAHGSVLFLETLLVTDRLALDEFDIDRPATAVTTFGSSSQKKGGNA